MYEAFYHLTAEPFLITSESHMAYRHPSYQKARSALQYALHAGEGFIMVTGRPGIGKTTLIHDLLANLNTKRAIARLDSSQLRIDNVLLKVAFSFGFSATSSRDKTRLFHSMGEFLAEQSRAGRKGLLLLSEAQTLSLDVLEEVRLLSVLEEGGEALLQIILLGEEKLVELVNSPGMEQLRQRILATCHLEPLTVEETREYVMLRLQAAGWEGDPKLDDTIFPVAHEFSQGIPRYINMLCSQLFRNGYANKQHALGIGEIRQAIENLEKDGFTSFTNIPGSAVMLKQSGSSPDTTKMKDHVTDLIEPQAPHKGVAQTPTTASPFDLAPRFILNRDDRENPLEPQSQLLNNRFRLKELISSSETSAMYKALDLRKAEAEGDNPYVAVKTLKQGHQNEQDRLILLHQVVNPFMELEHPDIIKIYDLDRDGSTIYVTIEYLSGQSLRSKIDAQAFKDMPTKEVLLIVNRLGEALSFAHAGGIVHCDFNPAKVIFTESGEIKITDFGMSRAIRIATKEDPDPKSDREYIYRYASPEKLENHSVDQRDDLYALACTMYEMLTGRHPFNKMLATTARDKGINPQKTNRLSLRQWKALQSALAFDRRNRTPTVIDFLADLNGKRGYWQLVVSAKNRPDHCPPQLNQLLKSRSPQLTPSTANKGNQYLIAWTAATAGFIGGFIGSVVGAYWFLPGSYEVFFQKQGQRAYEQTIEPSVARTQENVHKP